MRGRLQRLLGRNRKKTGLLIVSGLIAVGLVGSGAYAAFGGGVRQSASGDIDLQKGLIGHWKLDGNANDSTPFARNGIVSGTSNVADRKGKANAAKSFNGTSDTIQVPGFDSTILNGGSFSAGWTLSVWAKTNGANLDERILMGKAGCNAGIVTHGNGTLYRFSIWNSTCSGNATVAYAPTDMSQWHLLTATYNNGTLTFFGDGQLAGTATASNIWAYENNIDIGSANNGAWFFNGSLDDARIYNRALSAAEAKALYESYDTQINAGSGQGGLIGHWKLDGNAKDATPNANNGTVTGATLTADRKGRANSAYSFNGTSNYITMADKDIYSPSSITVNAWVYWTGGNQSNIVSKNGNSEYRYRVNSGGSVTVFDRGATNALSTAAGVVPTNQWTMVSFTGNTSGLKIFVNGQELASNTTAYAPPNTTGALYIGTYLGSNEFFTGSIDDVRIYNRVLAAAEITAMYNSYDSQINLNSSPTTSTSGGNINQGLVGYWPFSGNAKDATPYANNGAVSGAMLSADRKGRTNSAYSFNGTNNYIEVPPVSTGTSVSVSAWVYASSFNQNAILVNKEPVNTMWQLMLGAGLVVWRGNTTMNTTSCAIPGSGWHHLVATQTGSTAQIFIDGSQCASVSSAPAVGMGSGNTQIGRYAAGGGGYYFNGSIDDVRVYDRALSLNEVQTLHASPN